MIRCISMTFAVAMTMLSSTDCVTRKSGSVEITTCTDKNRTTECRSYMSGSVRKTSCRS